MQFCGKNGSENLKFAARREAKRMPTFDLYGKPPISGDFVEQDTKAQYILKKCSLEYIGVPSVTTGDGNCLFNAVSIALSGNEHRAAELRLRTSVEMALNSDNYTSRDDYEQLMENSPSFHASLKDCCSEGAYSSIWTIMALSSVVGLPINSVYPPMNGPKCKSHLALSKQFETAENKDKETLTILWSRMGPWRPPNWTGNHFVPVLRLHQGVSSPAKAKTKRPIAKHKMKPQQQPRPKKGPSGTQPQPESSHPVEEMKTPCTAKAPQSQFKPQEISTPLNTFVITDTLGNKIQVTQVMTQNSADESVLSDNDNTHYTQENSSLNMHENVSAVETDGHTDFKNCPSLNISSPGVSYENTNADPGDLKTENISFVYDCPSVNISGHSDSAVEDESSVSVSESVMDDSVMSDSVSELPVPNKVNQLPHDRWHKAEEIYKLLKERSFVHSDVPPGDKSNTFMIVDNTRNAERAKANKTCEFYEDCGIWISLKGNTCKSHYYLDGDNLVYCRVKNGKYCVRKRNNGKTAWLPLEPQPSDEKIVIISKYYATLKENPSFQKHVTYICKSADEFLANVALFEYKGDQPKATAFIRTNPKTVDKIKEKLDKKKPKEIYADLRRDDSLNCARDFRVIKNQKYEQKKKEKISRTNKVNVADEILEVLGMVNEHPFVQTIVHNKDQVPNVICYTTEQILDLKYFVKNEKKQQIGIDRTFNLGNYYVTTLVYKNQRVVRKNAKAEGHEEHPIFLGPVMFHKDATYKTYKSFLEFIKTELDCEVEAVELRLSETIEFGTDDEKALTKAIDHVFPSSKRLLCTKHLKDNVKHYLQNNVGMERGLRESVMDRIFGEEGITDANCTVDFQSRSEDLKAFLNDQFPRFESYFEKNLKGRIQQYVVEPCMNDPEKRNWTNNNAESINNILKLAVDWKPQGARELIEKIYSVTELHFLDYRSALHDGGNYRLTKGESSYRVPESLWRCKSEVQKKELFLSFLKDSKRRKRKYVDSSDGKFSVVSKAQTKATKICQRKRPRNERTKPR